jgi:hypothetical protein
VCGGRDWDGFAGLCRLVSNERDPAIGTTIFGHITLDPNTALKAIHFQGQRRSTMTTDGGFSLTQNLTGFNVRDASAGGGKYYVFDADVGTFGPTT